MTKLKSLALVLFVLVFLAGCGGGKRRGSRDAQSSHQLQSLIDLSVVAIQTGYYAQALQTLGEAERLAPNNPEVKHHIGRTYFHLNRLDDAVSYYERALALDPGKTDIHNSLGVVYMARKEYEKARAEFQLCIDDLTYAESSMSKLNMGLLEESTGHPENAMAYYRDIIAANAPTSPTAYYRLAHNSYANGDYRKAVDYLTPAVRLNPEFPEAFFLLGETFEKLNFPDEAAENYGRCVVIDPNSARGIEAQKRVRAIMKDYQ
ncbi:MAG: tetratricopeptide repeat protein [Deltaproteobacteria bacterium]|nr:tetratricopeptide repeat protein [Deltaproteobacteria bacterium]